jgi:translation initiation factor 1
VYSTDGGRVRPAPSPPPRPAKPQPSTVDVPDDGVVRLHRGKPGKGGKPLTLVSGLPGSETDLDALLKQLKQSLGTGGSRDGRVLNIQGDHREKLRERLEALGHRVKLAGG